jgi:hypothetical protein
VLKQTSFFIALKHTPVFNVKYYTREQEGEHIIMKKKITSLLVTTALCASLSGTSFANPTGNVDVVVNGISINMLAPPVIQQGRTLVPIREISQALGYTVNWNQTTGTVYLNNQNEVNDAPNPTNEKIVINGNPIHSDVPPQIINGRTMVPVRVISEAAGASVEWNQQNRRVTVSTESTLAFPNSLTLSFESAGLEQVEEIQTVPSTWEKIGSLKLGQMNQTELVLVLYEIESVGVPIINGVFTYNNQQFVLYDLAAGTTNEVKNQNLGLQFGSEPNQLRLVSAIGGEYKSQILVFTPSNQQWSVMNVFGRVVTSDNDGLLLQFPGKGLNPQEVSFIRFQNNEFVISSLSEAFRPFALSQNLDIQRISTIYKVIGGQPVIIVSLLKEGPSTQSYNLNGNTLILR